MLTSFDPALRVQSDSPGHLVMSAFTTWGAAEAINVSFCSTTRQDTPCSLLCTPWSGTYKAMIEYKSE